jgi:hypothetical protein
MSKKFLVLRDYVIRLQYFQQDAHKILSIHESAIKSRAIILEDTIEKLSNLSLKQDELFRESIRCIENELFRASVVLAWSGFIDYIFEKISVEGFHKIKGSRSNWKYDSSEKMIENQSDYSIIEALKEAKLITKDDMKAFQGYLNTRNNCAHPSDYFPDKNETIGYLSGLLNQIRRLQNRKF